MQLFVKCPSCLHLNQTTTCSCKNCNKNLLNEKVTVFFIDDKNKEPVNLLSIYHKSDDEYHSYLNDFYYYHYISEMNEREDFKSNVSSKQFKKLYSKVMMNEQIDLTQAIMKFLKMLVNINSDKQSYSLPIKNQYKRLSNLQITAVILAGIFYLKPESISQVRMDIESNAISFLSKLCTLNKKLNKYTNPTFIPKNINKYLLKLIVEITQDLVEFNNSIRATNLQNN